MIREIFRMRLEGTGITRITRMLNDRDITPPHRYLYEKGIVTSEYYAKSKLWNVDTILKILQSPTYIGNLAQRKTTAAYYKREKNHKNPMEDWVVIENTHEPIIDHDTFYKVQELIAQSKKDFEEKRRKSQEKYGGFTENVLKGFIVCRDCGAKMIRRASICDKNGKVYAYRFYCPTRPRKKDACSITAIREDFLLDGIYQAIKAQIKAAVDVQKIISDVMKSAGYRAKLTGMDNEIEAIKTKLKKLSHMKCALYDDYKEKLMTESEYLYAKRKYGQDAALMQERLDALLAEKEAFSETFTPNNKWITAFRNFEKDKKVTAEMLSKLLVCVKVYGSQSIEITYRYHDEYNKLMEFLEAQNTTEVRAV